MNESGVDTAFADFMDFDDAKRVLWCEWCKSVREAVFVESPFYCSSKCERKARSFYGRAALWIRRRISPFAWRVYHKTVDRLFAPGCFACDGRMTFWVNETVTCETGGCSASSHAYVYRKEKGWTIFKHSRICWCDE